jgi:hypothetical protein
MVETKIDFQHLFFYLPHRDREPCRPQSQDMVKFPDFRQYSLLKRPLPVFDVQRFNV